MKTLMVMLYAVVLYAHGPRTPPPAGRQQPPRLGVKTPGVQIPITELKPDAVFEVSGAPDWTVVDEQVWISNGPRNTVARLDPKTNTVVGNVEVGKSPCSGITAAFGSVWVPNCGDQTLSRIDVKTGNVTATIPITIGDSEGGLAAGAGSIWMMIDEKGTLARIDPANNQIVAKIHVPPGSYTVAFGEGAVWVTATETNALTRVDPQRNLVVKTIPVGKAPRFLTVGGGFVWTLNQTEGNVSKVDVKTNKVVATIDVGVPGGGGEIAYGEGSVWVTTFDFPISRIDPAADRVVQQFKGEGGDSIRVGLGSVWLCNLRAGNVWRLDPRRIQRTVAK